ncbi:MAG: hypothetical protein ABI867_00355 [Kofleriaceae bacterium]
MQSVWSVVHGSDSWNVVDVTGNPDKPADTAPSLTCGPTMHGAIVAAVSYANANNRRVTAILRIDGECLIVID